MPIINLFTLINAPRERVFDLARSIDAHQRSARRTGERAIAGVTSGLISLNEEVTWEARHLGVRQKLSVRVTAFDRPTYFQTAMIDGAFKRMVHDHTFRESKCGTKMLDRFDFRSPFGIVGSAIDYLILRWYMRRFLRERNHQLKISAESEEWRKFLPAFQREN